MRTRTARINTVRGLLREFGYVIPTGADHLVPGVMELIEDADVVIPSVVREMFHQVCGEIRALESRMRSVEQELKTLARQMPEVARLTSIPGIGLLTATAMVGFVGNIKRFRTSRHFASYLGLTPREHSSGNRRRMGRISKQGDRYLRMLLVHGGRSLLWSAHREGATPTPLQQWGLQKHEFRGHNKAIVALANKLARRVWAVWNRDCDHQAGIRRPDAEKFQYPFSELRLRFEMMAYRSDRRGAMPTSPLALRGRYFIGWLPARKFPSWPEQYHSTFEAEDTGAVD